MSDTPRTILSGANARQVGGSHYVAALQHWDMVVKWHIPYLEAQVMKYVTRCHKKNKRQDLEKALHFAEKIADCQTSSWLGQFALSLKGWFYPRAMPQVGHNQAYMECREYARANGLDPKQELLCWMAMSGSNPARLVSYIRDYMVEHYPAAGEIRNARWSDPVQAHALGEATARYVDQGGEGGVAA